MADRAAVFIDGNNWYHSLRDLGVADMGSLDYAQISMKLLGPRTWTATRYYIGRIPQSAEGILYAEQRRFLSSLEASDRRISTHLGRIESRPFKDPVTLMLRRYLADLPARIDDRVYRNLMQIAKKHEKETVLVEKAVDVMLAVDMVIMAVRNEFDAAYLLSADGDFTPAVIAAKTYGKKVYVASPARGAQLASVADSFISLPLAWFAECYKPKIP